MDRYTKKQLKIAGVFLMIILIIVGIIWFLNKPTRGTCFDGIQNQRETGIDCGGPCGPCEEPRDLVILFQEFIPTTEGNFDFIAKVKNSNTDWGIEILKYRFYMYDKNNEQVGYKEGKTYLLPQETKYLVEQKIDFPKLSRIDFQIGELIWQKLKNFNELEIRIKDSSRRLTQDGFSQVFGSVENKSNYDLNEIEIIGVLFSGKKIVAAGKTKINTVSAGETRYFEINWPYEISADSLEIKAYTNIYLNENFLKIYGTPEKFKEY